MRTKEEDIIFNFFQTNILTLSTVVPESMKAASMIAYYDDRRKQGGVEGRAEWVGGRGG